jgi:hypothetical protein
MARYLPTSAQSMRMDKRALRKAVAEMNERLDFIKDSTATAQYGGPVCQDTERTIFKLDSSPFRGSCCLVPK